MTVLQALARAYEAYETLEQEGLEGAARYLAIRRGADTESATLYEPIGRPRLGPAQRRRVEGAFRDAGHGATPGQARENVKAFFRRGGCDWTAGLD